MGKCGLVYGKIQSKIISKFKKHIDEKCWRIVENYLKNYSIHYGWDVSINDEYNFKLWHILKQSQINPGSNGACALEIFSWAEEVVPKWWKLEKICRKQRGDFRRFRDIVLNKK